MSSSSGAFSVAFAAALFGLLLCIGGTAFAFNLLACIQEIVEKIGGQTNPQALVTLGSLYITICLVSLCCFVIGIHHPLLPSLALPHEGTKKSEGARLRKILPPYTTGLGTMWRLSQ